MNYVERKLWETFPDGIVTKISSYPELYVLLVNYIREMDLNITPTQLVEKFGFTVKNRISQDELIRECMEKLSLHSFTDNKVSRDNLHEIGVYEKLILAGNIDAILAAHGYIYERKSRNVSRYDYSTIRKLYEEYAIGLSDLGKLFGASRQIIDNIVKYKTRDDNFVDRWDTDSLDESELEVILDMIIEKKKICIHNGITFSLLSDSKSKSFIVISDGNLDYVKVLFDEQIPKELHELLDESGVAYFDDAEIALMNNYRYVHVLDKRCLMTDNLSKDNVKWKRHLSANSGSSERVF